MSFSSLGENLDRIYFTESELIDGKYGGQLWAWGVNGYGKLGDGTTTNRSSPVTVVGGQGNWKQVASADSHVAAVKTDGTLWTWGRNLSGKLGDGTTTDRSSPGTTAGGGTDWQFVAVGPTSSAAIKIDGTLWTWGRNLYGELGDGTTTSRSSPGTTAGGGTNWKSAAFGRSHMVAIKTDGTLWTWGLNTYGQLGDGTTTDRSSPGTTAGGGTNWKQISAGGYTGHQSAGIKTDGTLWTWGSNWYGVLGDGTTTSKSSPGTTDGGGTTWKQVSVGGNHMAAIKTDGTLWSWGWGGNGEMGDGSKRTQNTSPTQNNLMNWKYVYASEEGFTAAIKADGTLWTWGNNTYGQLGLNDTNNRSWPNLVMAGSITDWKSIGQGFGSHISAILFK